MVKPSLPQAPCPIQAGCWKWLQDRQQQRYGKIVYRDYAKGFATFLKALGPYFQMKMVKVRALIHIWEVLQTFSEKFYKHFNRLSEEKISQALVGCFGSKPLTFSRLKTSDKKVNPTTHYLDSFQNISFSLCVCCVLLVTYYSRLFQDLHGKDLASPSPSCHFSNLKEQTFTSNHTNNIEKTIVNVSNKSQYIYVKSFNNRRHDIPETLCHNHLCQEPSTAESLRGAPSLCLD